MRCRCALPSTAALWLRPGPSAGPVVAAVSVALAATGAMVRQIRSRRWSRRRWRWAWPGATTGPIAVACTSRVSGVAVQAAVLLDRWQALGGFGRGPLVNTDVSFSIIIETDAARAACLWWGRLAPARHGIFISGPGHSGTSGPRSLHPDVTGPVARGRWIPVPPVRCKFSLGLGSSSSSTARSLARNLYSVVTTIVIGPSVWAYCHARTVPFHCTLHEGYVTCGAIADALLSSLLHTSLSHCTGSRLLCRWHEWHRSAPDADSTHIRDLPPVLPSHPQSNLRAIECLQLNPCCVH